MTPLVHCESHSYSRYPKTGLRQATVLWTGTVRRRAWKREREKNREGDIRLTEIKGEEKLRGREGESE
jgi:hypothetical protein